MNIAKHIIDLLYKEDCVIIPDFGGFVLSYQPSVINTELNIFTPPKKQPTFNSLLVKDDGLLISRVATYENIKYNEAKKEVALYTAMLNHKLKLREVVNIQNLGYLFIDKDNNLNFIAYPGVNYNTDSYGLSNFYMAPATAKPVVKIPEKENNPVKHISLSRKLKHAGVAAAILAFGIISFRAVDYSFRNVYQAAIIPTTDYNSKNVKDTEVKPEVNQVINELTNEEINIADDVKAINNTDVDSFNDDLIEVESSITETSTSDLVAARTVSPANIVQNPYVIVATLFNAEDASLELQRIIDLGYKDAVVIKSNSKYRIAVTDNTTKENLEQILKDAQDNITPAAWILYY